MKYTVNAQEGICHFEHLFDYWLEHFLERERILGIGRTQPLLVMQSTAMTYFRWFLYHKNYVYDIYIIYSISYAVYILCIKV